MKTKIIALFTVACIATLPTPAKAEWNWSSAFIGGLIAGTLTGGVVGGIAVGDEGGDAFLPFFGMGFLFSFPIGFLIGGFFGPDTQPPNEPNKKANAFLSTPPSDESINTSQPIEAPKHLTLHQNGIDKYTNHSKETGYRLTFLYLNNGRISH